MILGLSGIQSLRERWKFDLIRFLFPIPSAAACLSESIGAQVSVRARRPALRLMGLNHLLKTDLSERDGRFGGIVNPAAPCEQPKGRSPWDKNTPPRCFIFRVIGFPFRLLFAGTRCALVDRPIDRHLSDPLCSPARVKIHERNKL